MRILLIDNSKSESAQNTPLLKCLLQQLGEVTAYSALGDMADAFNESWDAVVLSGSSINVSERVFPQSIAKDISALVRFHDVAVLGVCFGMQLMAIVYGGRVERLPARREGWLSTTPSHCATGRSTLLSHPRVRPTGAVGVRRCLRQARHERPVSNAWYSHQDVVAVVPPGFATTALTGDGLVAAMESRRLKRYGVQFHPERSAEAGTRIIRRFLAIASEGRHRIPLRNRFSAMDGGARRRACDEKDPHGAVSSGSQAASGNGQDDGGDAFIDAVDTTRGAKTVSTDKWNRIALRLGTSNHALVAEEEEVPPSFVLLVWEEFRRRFRIPAMLV